MRAFIFLSNLSKLWRTLHMDRTGCALRVIRYESLGTLNVLNGKSIDPQETEDRFKRYANLITSHVKMNLAFAQSHNFLPHFEKATLDVCFSSSGWINKEISF